MAPRLLSCFRRRSSNNSSTSSSSDGNHEENVTADWKSEEQWRGGPVVVELFSSQGCKASPEAELLFARLGRGDFKLEVPLILMAFHVDVWDYMGWKDPFGSAQWTVRHKAYVEALNLDTLVTPQIVVHGQVPCIANDEDAILSCIASAPRYPTPTFQANFRKPTPESLQVILTGALRWRVDSEGANVMVALYESGLVTSCSGGVNNGRFLANDYVVRRLDKLCNVKDISSRKTISGALTFPLWEGFNPAKCGLVIFGEAPSHRILGAQSIKLPNNL